MEFCLGRSWWPGATALSVPSACVANDFAVPSPQKIRRIILFSASTPQSGRGIGVQTGAWPCRGCQTQALPSTTPRAGQGFGALLMTQSLFSSVGRHRRRQARIIGQADQHAPSRARFISVVSPRRTSVDAVTPSRARQRPAGRTVTAASAEAPLLDARAAIVSRSPVSATLSTAYRGLCVRICSRLATGPDRTVPSRLPTPNNPEERLREQRDNRTPLRDLFPLLVL